MPIKDGFDPAHPLPRFLVARAEQDPGHALDQVVPAPPSRVSKANILLATGTAIGIAGLAVGIPMALFAEGSASLAGSSSPQSTPAIESASDAPASVLSTADAQASSPTTMDAPIRDEIAASEPAGRDQTENNASTSEALYTQFQAWAAEQEAKARGEPIQPVQDAPAQVVQDVPAPAAENAPASAAENARVPSRLVQKRRHIRSVRNARAEMRAQKARKQVTPAQSQRAQRPPIQDARAQDQSVQNAQQPSFLPIFGLGN